MNKSILIVPTVALVLALNAGVSLAAGENNDSQQCQPIYGGGESCVKTPQFEINKTVQNPKTQAYVDNLSVGDAKFAPTEVVTFKITVKNTTETKLTNITIKDIFPNVVDFSGGIGDYDANSRTLTIKLDSLDSNESRDFFVQAKVLAKDKLPDQNVSCVVNQSTITAAEKTAQDNAQFCIEKGLTPPVENPANPPTTKGGNPVNPGTTTPGTTTKGGTLPLTPGKTTNPGTTTVNPPTTKGGKPVFPPTTAKTTPETGPESLALIGLIPSAVGGMILRRKTR